MKSRMTRGAEGQRLRHAQLRRQAEVLAGHYLREVRAYLSEVDASETAVCLALRPCLLMFPGEPNPPPDDMIMGVVAQTLVRRDGYSVTWNARVPYAFYITWGQCETVAAGVSPHPPVLPATPTSFKPSDTPVPGGGWAPSLGGGGLSGSAPPSSDSASAIDRIRAKKASYQNNKF